MTTSTLSYLGLGTNLGNRIQNLRAAQMALPPQVQVLRTSRIYETPPWGFIAQPTFLNQVFEVQTDLTPLALLEYLKAIEVNLGRIPTFRYGPRQMDIDILFYGDQVIESPKLTIPHPRLSERAFMLVPLTELAPDWVHPVLHQTIYQMLAQVDPSGVEVFHD
jgi:2-amino-4-hydroxy-6-hydroxymethyldihydropteridine diphosphokinase